MERLHYSNFDLAGFTYWDGALVFDQLKVGTPLRLQRELDNGYDPKAIAIYHNEHKLGYVPRSCNSDLAKFCQQGYASIFEVRINRISASEDPENQIGVVIHLRHQEGQ